MSEISVFSHALGFPGCAAWRPALWSEPSLTSALASQRNCRSSWEMSLRCWPWWMSFGFWERRKMLQVRDTPSTHGPSLLPPCLPSVLTHPSLWPVRRVSAIAPSLRMDSLWRLDEWTLLPQPSSLPVFLFPFPMLCLSGPVLLFPS